MQQNKISVFINSRILFEPMFVIFGTLCYIGTFLLFVKCDYGYVCYCV